MSKLFSGQVTLITGDTAGISRATTLAFAVAGVKVVVADLGSTDSEGTIEAIRQADGETLFIRCDVTRDAEVKALIEGCAAVYGRPDYVFNSAGIEIEQGELVGDNETEFDAIMAVSVKGVWLCMRHQIPLMLAQSGGAIVDTVSVAGLDATPKMSIYTAPKHVMIGLAKLAVIEHAKKGIHANAMCPTVTSTDMSRRAYETNSCKAKFAAVIHPLDWVRRVEEIIIVVLYLCSDNTGFTTGIAPLVDDGTTTIRTGGDTIRMPRREASALYYRSARDLTHQIAAGGLTWVENPGPGPVSIASER